MVICTPGEVRSQGSTRERGSSLALAVVASSYAGPMDPCPCFPNCSYSNFFSSKGCRRAHRQPTNDNRLPAISIVLCLCENFLYSMHSVSRLCCGALGAKSPLASQRRKQSGFGALPASVGGMRRRRMGTRAEKPGECSCLLELELDVRTS